MATHFDLPLSRRDCLRVAFGASLGGVFSTHWFQQLAASEAVRQQRKRSCILLWMSGGPSQLDTFDPKPGHENGGPFQAIETSVPGIRISEHLPKLADWTKRMSLVRSMSTREGDHERATFLIRTGYLPTGPVQYPSIGALLAKELGSEQAELPDYISIAPMTALSRNAFGSGFLGPKYSPLVVGASGQNGASLTVQNMDLPPGITPERSATRLSVLERFEQRFRSTRPGTPAESHQSAYAQAVRMMSSRANRAFHLEEESSDVRDRYGRNTFGQGCLLARRLVERGVPFVEVTLSGVDGNQGLGWDTHQENFENVRRLSGVLDPAWATLMGELDERGLLDSTLIVWMGEFGRTPKINENTGRDHFPNAWSTVLAGGGIRGGQVIGKTSDDGMSVIDRPVKVADLLGTVCLALGVDPTTQNLSNVDRPIRLVDQESDPVYEAVEKT